MLSAYPACFIKEENGYSVIFPDLNHLATCGHTLEEALTSAVDCLAGYIYTFQKEGEEFSPPSPVNEVITPELIEKYEIEDCDYFVNIVTVDVAEYAKIHFEKAVKKTLTIPAWLNDLARKNDINFSQVLQEALKEKLHV